MTGATGSKRCADEFGPPLSVPLFSSPAWAGIPFCGDVLLWRPHRSAGSLCISLFPFFHSTTNLAPGLDLVLSGASLDQSKRGLPYTLCSALLCLVFSCHHRRPCASTGTVSKPFYSSFFSCAENRASSLWPHQRAGDPIESACVAALDRVFALLLLSRCCRKSPRAVTVGLA